MNPRIQELADALVAADVGAAFGVPGSGLSWQLISALEQRGVPFTGTRHEAAAAIMAGAYGRQSGRLGCSVTIKGPGLANSLPGILSNAYEQWPAISVAEAYGPSSPPSRMHKRLDQRAITAPVVKAYATLGDVRATVAKLASIARAERPGPVHLDLFAEPGGVLDVHAPSPEPGVGDLARATEMIAAARRPVVIVGSIATSAAWAARLATLRVPILTTVAAKGICNERLPYAAGIYTGDGKALAPETVLLVEADLVIGLGLRNVEILTPRHPKCPLVLVDGAGPETAAGFDPDVHVHGADDAAFDSVLDALAGAEWGTVVVETLRREVSRTLTADPWLPGRVFATVEQLLPMQRRLVLDTGSFCTVAEHGWRASDHHEVLLSANGRYMGTAIPMALGAAIADPDVPHVCAIGDGGMMYAAELKLAVERRLPIMVLLLSDGRYGSIAGAPSAPGLSMDAVTMANPSWYRVAEGMGMPAVRVTDVASLERTVCAWLVEGGPIFVEAPFAPDAYARMTLNIR